MNLAIIAVPVFVLYMAWRFLRAYERRQRQDLDESTNARLAVLEESTIRIESQLNTLVEEHRFLTRVLGGRQEGASAMPPDERERRPALD